MPLQKVDVDHFAIHIDDEDPDERSGEGSLAEYEANWAEVSEIRTPEDWVGQHEEADEEGGLEEEKEEAGEDEGCFEIQHRVRTEAGRDVKVTEFRWPREPATAEAAAEAPDVEDELMDGLLEWPKEEVGKGNEGLGTSSLLSSSILSYEVELVRIAKQAMENVRRRKEQEKEQEKEEQEKDEGEEDGHTGEGEDGAESGGKAEELSWKLKGRWKGSKEGERQFHLVEEPKTQSSPPCLLCVTTAGGAAAKTRSATITLQAGEVQWVPGGYQLDLERSTEERPCWARTARRGMGRAVLWWTRDEDAGRNRNRGDKGSSGAGSRKGGSSGAGETKKGAGKWVPKIR